LVCKICSLVLPWCILLQRSVTIGRSKASSTLMIILEVLGWTHRLHWFTHRSLHGVLLSTSKSLISS
jgi:hypothetical protein